MAAQFLRCRGRSLWLQRCDFRTVKKPFPLSTAAQNIHVFRRKSPLHKIHFFEWLKTANFSTACGTSTLKSPPSRAFAAPHVHPRPRKRLARCTLDCGFKTPESPELRGFVAGPWALATAALYLAFFFVLEKAVKSAGNAVIPTFPAHCPHGLQHLRHKRPSLAFSGENGYTLGPAQRIAHKGTHGETGGVLGGGWYHYPRSVPHVSETLRGQGIERQTLPFLGLGRVCSRRTQRACGTAMRLCASLFRGAAAPLGCVALLPLFVQHDLLGWKDLTKRSGRVTITRNNRTASRLALVQRLRWAVK